MRNLLEYPITLEEKIAVLEGLRDDLMKEPSFGDIRPVVLSDLIQELRPVEAVPVPKPKPEYSAPGNVIPGPRVRLRYGTAATAIRLSSRQWRLVEHGTDVKWISIDDFSHAENIIGKRVTCTLGKRTMECVVGPPEELDEAFTVVYQGLTLFGFHNPAEVKVIDDPTHLNKFEAVLADPDQAKKCRRQMIQRIRVTGGDLRQELLDLFGLTEDDLKDAA